MIKWSNIEYKIFSLVLIAGLSSMEGFFFSWLKICIILLGVVETITAMHGVVGYFGFRFVLDEGFFFIFFVVSVFQIQENVQYV